MIGLWGGWAKTTSYRGRDGGPGWERKKKGIARGHAVRRMHTAQNSGNHGAWVGAWCVSSYRIPMRCCRFGKSNFYFLIQNENKNKKVGRVDVCGRPPPPLPPSWMRYSWQNPWRGPLNRLLHWRFKRRQQQITIKATPTTGPFPGPLMTSFCHITATRHSFYLFPGPHSNKPCLRGGKHGESDTTALDSSVWGSTIISPHLRGTSSVSPCVSVNSPHLRLRLLPLPILILIFYTCPINHSGERVKVFGPFPNPAHISFSIYNFLLFNF